MIDEDDDNPDNDDVKHHQFSLILHHNQREHSGAVQHDGAPSKFAPAIRWYVEYFLSCTSLRGFFFCLVLLFVGRHPEQTLVVVDIGLRSRKHKRELHYSMLLVALGLSLSPKRGCRHTTPTTTKLYRAQGQARNSVHVPFSKCLPATINPKRAVVLLIFVLRSINVGVWESRRIGPVQRLGLTIDPSLILPRPLHSQDSWEQPQYCIGHQRSFEKTSSFPLES